MDTGCTTAFDNWGLVYLMALCALSDLSCTHPQPETVTLMGADCGWLRTNRFVGKQSPYC